MKFSRLVSICAAIPISAAAALIASVAPAPADTGLPAVYPVTVDCGDGAPISANVDLQGLTKLQGAIPYMAADPANPADVGCALSSTNSNSQGSDTRPFVIGGGSYGAVFNCSTKFKIKASVDGGGRVHGFQRATAPEDNCGFGPGEGHITATVVCVAVSGKVAEMRGIVTESTGPLFNGFFGIAPGDVFFSQVRENPDPVKDEINQFKDPSGSLTCVPQLDSTQSQPIDRGDIDVEG